MSENVYKKFIVTYYSGNATVASERLKNVGSNRTA